MIFADSPGETLPLKIDTMCEPKRHNCQRWDTRHTALQSDYSTIQIVKPLPVRIRRSVTPPEENRLIPERPRRPTTIVV
jgi:hypothetical protein